MLCVKRLIFLLIAPLVLPLVLGGCGGAGTAAPRTAPKRRAPAVKRVELPSTIGRADRSIWGKELYLMPPDHPDRRALRDLLVEALRTEFEALDETEGEKRLELFREALALHGPEEFKPGRVAAGAVPMARWTVSAYERRGDEAVVLAALKFLMLADPEDVASKERYLELVEWSESVRLTVADRIERLSSLIEMYRKMVQLVPDREVVERLAEAYVERHRIIMAVFKSGRGGESSRINPMEILRHGRSLQTLPLDVIYAFFLAGDPAGARKHLAGLVADGGLRVEFVELLDRIFEGEDKADSYFTLARYLSPIDPRAGLEACIVARAADRKDPRFPLCIGRQFEELDQSECAIDFYAEAARVAPASDIYSEVLELTRRALLRVHLKELAEVSRRAIATGEKLVDRALALDPDEDDEMRSVVAALLFTMGEVEFDDGLIDAAKSHFEKSFQAMTNVPALVKLAEVHYLLRDFEAGMGVLDRTHALEARGERASPFWGAIIAEKRGDLLAALGRSKDSEQSYRESLAKWNLVENTDEAPLSAVRRGIILDRLGDQSASQTAFRLAVRLDPDRQATYAQLLSFLVIRGRLEDAKEFYRLLYNQDQIEAMWKIYYSLWVEGLSRRQGKGSFDLAKGYLEHSKGGSWQDKLASFFVGGMTVEALHAAAINTGQRVEVEYYAALLDLVEGKKTEARARLGKVIDSRLLGFFEYRMARALLDEE